MPFVTTGTHILTPKGERLVQELNVGDLITTKHGKDVQLRWIGSATLNTQEFHGNPHLHPIVVKQHALHKGAPSSDMAVSQNLQIEVDPAKTPLFFVPEEGRAPAKKLIDHHGIRPVEPFKATYVHFHFDRHQIVRANGAWIESFSPLDNSVGAGRNAQRTELFYFFPELRDLEVDMDREEKTSFARGLWGRLAGS